LGFGIHLRSILFFQCKSKQWKLETDIGCIYSLRWRYNHITNHARISTDARTDIDPDPDADTNADPDANANADPDADANLNPNPNPNVNANADADNILIVFNNLFIHKLKFKQHGKNSYYFRTFNRRYRRSIRSIERYMAHSIYFEHNAYSLSIGALQYNSRQNVDGYRHSDRRSNGQSAGYSV
jgi:hypothetical protein